jgi:hypothetical protein
MVRPRPWLVLLLVRLLPGCAFILHRSLLGHSSSVSISDTALVLTGSQPRGWRLSAYRGPMQIPLDKLEFRYTRSSGPGGQNVNKVRVRLLWRDGPVFPLVLVLVGWGPDLARPVLSVDDMMTYNDLYSDDLMGHSILSHSSIPESSCASMCQRQTGYRKTHACG